jgi:hypothetical protein
MLGSFLFTYLSLKSGIMSVILLLKPKLPSLIILLCKIFEPLALQVGSNN